MADWWLSWYTSEALGQFELHSPWWISGYTGDGEKTIIVGAVKAESEEAAWEQIRQSYDTPPETIEERFIDPLDRENPFSDRFPKADWMAWDDDGATCACESMHSG